MFSKVGGHDSDFRLLIRDELAHHHQGQPPYFKSRVYFRYQPTVTFMTLAERYGENNHVNSRAARDFSKIGTSSCNILRLIVRFVKMTPEKLDLWFPFFVFGYGAIMTFTLHHPVMQELAERRLPFAVQQQMKAHRGLGLICLVVGGMWSLQNLWL